MSCVSLNTADKKSADRRLRCLSFDVGIRHLAFCVLSVPPRRRNVSPLDRVRGIEIEQWDVIDLDRVPSVDACCKRLVKELHARFAFQGFDIVLIERQPKHRSIIMVAVQMFLCCYFHVAATVTAAAAAAAAAGLATPAGPAPTFDIKFIHASRKLTCESSAYGVAQDTQEESLSKQERTRPRVQRFQRFPPKDRRRLDGARYRDNKKKAIETCKMYLNDILQDYANAALLELYPKKDDLCDAFLQAVAYFESA